MKNTLMLDKAYRIPSFGCLLAGLVVISACSENRERIYEASNSGGDYAVLDCEKLREAQLSIEQRLGASTGYSKAGEPAALLEKQRAPIATIRKSRQCPDGFNPIAVTPSKAVADAPDKDLVEDAFLQVATFREMSNLDKLVARLTTEGFPVQVRPITLAGAVYNRVIVGPLTKTSEIARIDAAILKLGLADAFFLKQ